MKIKILTKIFILLTIFISSISCSKALLFEDNSTGLNGKTGTLIISGIVTDKEANTPLEGIEISFQCDADDFEKITTFTGNDGVFLLKAEGFVTKITGCVSARDLHGKYKPIRRDVTINWKGESYDSKTGLFAINNCNFQLNK